MQNRPIPISLSLILYQRMISIAVETNCVIRSSAFSDIFLLCYCILMLLSPVTVNLDSGSQPYISKSVEVLGNQNLLCSIYLLPVYSWLQLLKSFQASYPALTFPPLPERGNFDMREVLKSPYFFN